MLYLAPGVGKLFLRYTSLPIMIKKHSPYSAWPATALGASLAGSFLGSLQRG
jgi:hypothetical protein